MLRQFLCLWVQGPGPLAAAGVFRFVFGAGSRPEVQASQVKSQQDVAAEAVLRSCAAVASAPAAGPDAVPGIVVDGKRCAIWCLPACPDNLILFIASQSIVSISLTQGAWHKACNEHALRHVAPGLWCQDVL